MFDLFKKKDTNSNKLATGLLKIFSGKKIDNELLDKLEELLIVNDIDITITEEIIDFLRNNRFDKNITIDDLKNIIYDKLYEVFKNIENCKDTITSNEKPYVIMFMGVNGSGKTTFIGKFANKLVKHDNKKVLMVACDTFRAGADKQLQILAERSGSDIFLQDQPNQDPASVAFKAYKFAQEKSYDILLIDTAGRLQNNINLMNELTKINNVLNKIDKAIPHKRYLTLDATVGHNVDQQIKLFDQFVKIDGIIMNKMDGTAKGGSLVGAAKILKKPILALGIGEGIDDIQDFDPKIYLQNLLDLHE